MRFPIITVKLRYIAGLNIGGEVQLVGFGTFKRTKRAERTGVNPQTGEKISIAETYTPKFTAGKEFKDAVKA